MNLLGVAHRVALAAALVPLVTRAAERIATLLTTGASIRAGLVVALLPIALANSVTARIFTSAAATTSAFGRARELLAAAAAFVVLISILVHEVLEAIMATEFAVVVLRQRSALVAALAECSTSCGELAAASVATLLFVLAAETAAGPLALAALVGRAAMLGGTVMATTATFRVRLFLASAMAHSVSKSLRTMTVRAAILAAGSFCSREARTLVLEAAGEPPSTQSRERAKLAQAVNFAFFLVSALKVLALLAT